MANFKELEININSEYKTFVFNGKEIKIKPFLSTSEKYDIAMISIQQAQEDGYINPMLLDIFFHLNLVFSYTDIEFDIDDRQDPFELSDKLKLSGLLSMILNHIDENEYAEMLEYIDEIKAAKERYMRSVVSIASKLIDDLPANAKAALDIVDNFDENKFAAVKDFAEAANGNRPIS